MSANYYKLGLNLGILDMSQLQLWVNSKIEESDRPDDIYLELAYLKESDILGALSLLNNIEDAVDDYDNLRLVLGAVSDEQLDDIKFCRSLASKLYHFWVDHDYDGPDDLNEIGFFDDEYDLAVQGITCSVEQWHNDFKIFVNSVRILLTN